MTERTPFRVKPRILEEKPMINRNSGNPFESIGV